MFRASADSETLKILELIRDYFEKISGGVKSERTAENDTLVQWELKPENLVKGSSKEIPKNFADFLKSKGVKKIKLTKDSFGTAQVQIGERFIIKTVPAYFIFFARKI